MKITIRARTVLAAAAISCCSLAHSEDTQKPKEHKSFWRNFSASLGVSDLEHHSTLDELDVDMNLAVANKNREKKEFDFSYDYDYTRKQDVFTQAKITDTKEKSEINFDVNKLWKRLGYTSHISYERDQENEVDLVRYDISASPLGLKYDIYENDQISELSLSYLPLYRIKEYFTNFEDPAVFDKNLDRFLTHGLRLNFAAAFFDGKFTVSEELWWKNNTEYNSSDTTPVGKIFTSTLTLGYRFSDYFSATYTNIIDYDEVREQVHQLPNTERQNKITIVLSWNQ